MSRSGHGGGTTPISTPGDSAAYPEPQAFRFRDSRARLSACVCQVLRHQVHVRARYDQRDVAWQPVEQGNNRASRYETAPQERRKATPKKRAEGG